MTHDAAARRRFDYRELDRLMVPILGAVHGIANAGVELRASAHDTRRPGSEHRALDESMAEIALQSAAYALAVRAVELWTSIYAIDREAPVALGQAAEILRLLGLQGAALEVRRTRELLGRAAAVLPCDVPAAFAALDELRAELERLR
jgi:hypothetical protein